MPQQKKITFSWIFPYFSLSPGVFFLLFDIINLFHDFPKILELLHKFLRSSLQRFMNSWAFVET